MHSNNVRQLATRGAGASLFYGFVGLGTQICAIIVLARLLSPRDFGLVTMVTTFSLLFMNFGMNGFTEAIIQHQELRRELVSNVFWINLLGSCLLAVVFAAGGLLLNKLYGDTRLAGIAKAIAFTIVLTGMQVVPLALMRKAMRFSEVAANDWIARVLSVVVTILLARIGWGYWALVAGAVVAPASSCLGGWILCPWRPQLPRRVAGTGAMVRFAANTYARFSTGYFSSNFDNFLIGWRLGPVSLGFYKKAYDLFVLPAGQFSTGLTAVAVSALSRLRQDSVRYKAALLSALEVMAFVGMGISGELTLTGKDLVLMLLGPQWGESGRLFTILAPATGVMILYFTHVWIHLSLGHADRWFRWGNLDLAITTIFLLVGLHWRAEGIAAAWCAGYFVITLPALWYACKPIHIGITTLTGVIWRYLVATCSAVLVTLMVTRTMASLLYIPGPIGATIRILVISAVFISLYLGFVILLHRSCEPLLRSTTMLREMLSRRESVKTSTVESETPGFRSDLEPAAVSSGDFTPS